MLARRSSMAQNSQQRLHSNHDHPHLGRFLLVSLVVHILTVALLVGGWFGSPHKPKPQAYFVDLVHKPVLNPQAGRPEPRPTKKDPIAPKPEVKPQVKPKPKPEPKPKPAKTVAPVKPAPPVVAAKPTPQQDLQAEQQRRAAIEELRARQTLQQEIENIRQRLAARQQGGEVNADVPVGMPEGKGDEIGVSILTHIQAFIQQNWALSPYLLDRARIGTIEATVLLAYSTEGTLSRYRVVEPSGDEQFDDSIKRAIIKSKHLQHKLPRSTELTVVFNLKEMAATRR
ncbi:MAG: hypothetical protein C0614_11695 [Desulfuromonas sp.]|nr:MAG: hypothetical protein C0614_11695 [Desulfuromonas sp.]